MYVVHFVIWDFPDYDILRHQAIAGGKRLLMGAGRHLVFTRIGFRIGPFEALFKAKLKFLLSGEAKIKLEICPDQFNLNPHISPSFRTSCAAVEMMLDATEVPSGIRARNWILTGPALKQRVSACEKES